MVKERLRKWCYPINPTEHHYSLGFSSALEESTDVRLDVTGSIPSWLQGRLIRNGPALFAVGGTRLTHWFDGFAKLHRFDISAREIVYSSKFLQSDAYKGALSSGHLTAGEFASQPSMTTFERLKNVFSPSLTDNANVNVIPLKSSWLALTETCNMVRFSPDSLETLGIARFEDDLSALITTAHPLIDRKSHEVYNLCINVGPRNHYLLTRTDWQTLSRKVLAKIPVRQTGYIHSISQTERYLVIVEPPMLLNSAELIMGAKPYIDCYNWHVGRGTRLIVVEKTSGNYFTCDFEDRFFFHQINAFETKDRICLDLASYADAEVIDSFRLRNLIDTGGPIPRACYERIEIDIANKRVITRDRAECFFELPTINRQFDCSKYRFVYGAGSSSNHSFFNQLVKLDTTDESVQRFSQKDCYYGEPVFVPRTEGAAEDDGIVLSIELDAISKQSSLLFIDAKSLHEVTRALLPHMVPFGFHGQFIRTGNT